MDNDDEDFARDSLQDGTFSENEGMMDEPPENWEYNLE